MYTCQICGKSSQPGQKMARKVIAVRPRKYPATSGKAGVGWEILRELRGHPECTDPK